MCGIYGYVGSNALTQTLNGIKNLEYRGYDSAGIAFNSYNFKLNDNIKNFKDNVFLLNNGFNIIKQQGEIKKLEEIINTLKPKSEIAIGHTRWATHGKPSVVNSHPHFSENKNWIVVHNGIIENYLELKKELSQVKFSSETDTEVVAQLLSKFYNGDVLQTLKCVCDKLVGSYALAVMHISQPNKIYVAKLNSPCVVGCGKNHGVVCSDLNSIGKTEKVFVLPNNTFSIVEKGKVEIFNNKLELITLKPVKNASENVGGGLNGYSHYMLKEINEIPNAIKNTVVNYNTFNKIKKALPKKVVKSLKNVLIVGCGTAYHAGLMGKRILEDVNEIKTDVEIASEFKYNNFKPKKGTLAIFISQSGETADTIKAVRLCKAYGLKTVAITNVKNSSICFEVDYCLFTSAGKEVAVASTKAYNCQVAMFYLISAYLKALNTDAEGIVLEESKKLVEIANLISELDFSETKQVAEKIKNSKSLYMIGRGLDYNLALEASLKLKEISYIHSEAYPAGELKHGTISLIDQNTFVFAFITQPHIKEKTLSNVWEVVSRGGKVVLFSQFKLDGVNKLDKFIKLPKFDEFYMPLVLVVYMQLIAYHTSLYVGNNPDKPRSLAKSVTVE